jgi:uncharacterized protein (TIGR00251 family)
MSIWYRYNNENLILTLYIQPGAKSSAVVGLHGDALKIKLASPPIEGRANTALLQFVAAQFGIPVRQIKLLRGEKSRHKTLELIGCTTNPETVWQQKGISEP